MHIRSYHNGFPLLTSDELMRIGLLGGTFDPVHYGHLLLAESCREQGRLDEVWFVPAAVPPHKQNQTLSSAAARLEMLRLAVGGHEAFRVSEIELTRGGVSYTVDTLAAIRAERPDAELFLLLGGDSLVDMPTWRDPRRILELARPMTVGRPGSPTPNYRVLDAFVDPAILAGLAALHVEMPLVGISSRDLRRRVAEGRSIRYQVPRAVEQYIATAGLYKTPTSG
jgi:nicotinate-nucleotide adenylyltransferase